MYDLNTFIQGLILILTILWLNYWARKYTSSNEHYVFLINSRTVNCSEAEEKIWYFGAVNRMILFHENELRNEIRKRFNDIKKTNKQLFLNEKDILLVFMKVIQDFIQDSIKILSNEKGEEVDSNVCTSFNFDFENDTITKDHFCTVLCSKNGGKNLNFELIKAYYIDNDVYIRNMIMLFTHCTIKSIYSNEKRKEVVTEWVNKKIYNHDRLKASFYQTCLHKLKINVNQIVYCFLRDLFPNSASYDLALDEISSLLDKDRVKRFSICYSMDTPKILINLILNYISDLENITFSGLHDYVNSKLILTDEIILKNENFKKKYLRKQNHDDVYNSTKFVGVDIFFAELEFCVEYVIQSEKLTSFVLKEFNNIALLYHKIQFCIYYHYLIF